ncbi:terpene cyclase/mutase family protein [Streptomyces pactum]|uniref:Terpene cyclase/mutase family protein n=1 Tax=Streptomyces pactum TaxID=68249 RepID=A0ABS0NHD2_9ACTN|nr:terpene cyclase/mutase family protein [Streptomyces pactum]MBH5334599.1 terpene cyclase/mutase family protein [Streptomyces pactum]
MNARRSAAALAVSVVLGAALAPVAFADGSLHRDTPKPRESALPKALYGSADPRFDGVWRQSLAILAQDASGLTPPPAAVEWLAGQQCEDGGFAAYRPKTTAPCDPEKGEFSDATAAAVQALASVGGRGAVVEKGVDWLKRHQNDDGGWGMNPGGPSDANSTATVIGAFAATGQDPARVTSAKGGKSPYDALLALQLGCDAGEDERGAFAYQPDKGELHANPLATTAAALAAHGKGFVFDVPEGDEPVAAPSCADRNGDDGKARRDPGDGADAASAYLSAVLAGNGQHLNSAMPGQEDQPDVGGTADAVLALAAGGHRDAAAKPLTWLTGKEAGAVAWAKDQPAALAKLILASRAAGADPRDFGGTDLLRALGETGPGTGTPAPDPSGTEKEKKDDKDDDGNGGYGVWWIVGVGAVAGIGIGFLLSGRKKQQF